MTSYSDYVQHYIPLEKRPLLDAVLDHGHDIAKDLNEIAQYPTRWEQQLSHHLELTKEEIDDINEIHDPTLRRRRVLQVWKDKKRLNATYGRLLNVCILGGDTRTATKICELIAQKPLPQKSPATPQATPMAHTQQVSNTRATSLWDREFDQAFMQLIKYVDPVTGEHKQVKIFGELAPIWRDVAMCIGLKEAEISTIENAGAGKTPSTCMMQVLGRWENNAINLSNYEQYPETWRGVCNLLDDSGQGKLAKNLRSALNADYSTLRKNYSEDLVVPGRMTESVVPPSDHLPPTSQPHSGMPTSNGSAHAPPTQAESLSTSSATNDRQSSPCPAKEAKKKKMTADEVAEWLEDEGIDENDVQIMKERGINERIFMRLNSKSDKLQDVSQATKDQLPDLQDEMKQRES